MHARPTARCKEGGGAVSSKSKYAPTTTTKRLPRMTRRKAGGEVSMPQLYRDIEAGYRHFLARRTKAMALGIKLIDLKKHEAT